VRHPEEVARRLRAFGEAGLRHVVLDVASALLSPRATLYGLVAVGRIARLLRGDS
jgi:phthiodiolone/phenolphthiodiolone dimycocerosates ketoreductase